MNYDIDFFLNRAENTPDELWCVGVMHHNNQSCFAGQCDSIEELFALSKICGDVTAITDINDGQQPRYQQPTPRLRIIAYLMDKKAEKAVEQVKEIISEPKTLEYEIQC